MEESLIEKYISEGFSNFDDCSFNGNFIDNRGTLIVNAQIIRKLFIKYNNIYIQERSQTFHLSISNVIIDDYLDLSYLNFPSGFSFENCFFKKNVNINGLSSGTLNFNNCRFQYGIDAENINIKGSLNCEDTKLYSTVNLRGACINGDLNFRKSFIKSYLKVRKMSVPNKKSVLAITMDTANIKGSLFFQEARLIGDFRGSRLTLDGAGFFCEGFCMSSGLFQMKNASIGDNLRFSKGKFNNKDSYSIKLPQTKIKGILDLEKLSEISGKVDLTRLNTHAFGFDESFLAATEIELDGVHIQKFDKNTNDINLILKLLRKQPKNDIEKEFKVSPWVNFIQVFKSNGDVFSTQKLSYEFNKLKRKHSSLGIYSVIFSYLDQVTTGFGLKPHRILYSMSILVFVFSLYWNSQWMSNKLVFIHSNQSKTLENYEKNKIFSPVLFSLDLMLPMANLGIKSKWNIKIENDKVDTKSSTILWIYVLNILVGWVLLSLFIFSITSRMKDSYEFYKN